MKPGFLENEKTDFRKREFSFLQICKFSKVRIRIIENSQILELSKMRKRNLGIPKQRTAHGV